MLYYHLYLYDLFAFNVLKLNGNAIKNEVPVELLDAVYILLFPNKSINPSHHQQEQEKLGRTFYRTFYGASLVN